MDDEDAAAAAVDARAALDVVSRSLALLSAQQSRQIFALWVLVALLAPLFFADPAGAVVGKFCSRRLGRRLNPAWFQQKTVCGSLAVFTTSTACVLYIQPL